MSVLIQKNLHPIAPRQLETDIEPSIFIKVANQHRRRSRAKSLNQKRILVVVLGQAGEMTKVDGCRHLTEHRLGLRNIALGQALSQGRFIDVVNGVRLRGGYARRA